MPSHFICITLLAAITRIAASPIQCVQQWDIPGAANLAKVYETIPGVDDSNCPSGSQLGTLTFSLTGGSTGVTSGSPSTSGGSGTSGSGSSSVVPVDVPSSTPTSGISGGSISEDVNSANTQSGSQTNGTGNSATIVPATVGGSSPGTGDGVCGAGGRNVVFNTGAPKNAGFPDVTWKTLTDNGVTNFSTLLPPLYREQA